MIDIKEIEKTIEELEECGNTTYNTCNKLAILYIVRDHYKGGDASDSTASMQAMSTPSMSMMK